jgi:hypothetical protein
MHPAPFAACLAATSKAKCGREQHSEPEPGAGVAATFGFALCRASSVMLWSVNAKPTPVLVTQSATSRLVSA